MIAEKIIVEEFGILKKHNDIFSKIDLSYPFDYMEEPIDLRGQIIQVSAVTKGSIVLHCVMVGSFAVAYWYLTQVASTTVKEAWKQTDTHRKAVKFLNQKIGTRSKRVSKEFDRNRIAEKHTIEFLGNLSKKHREEID